MLVEAMDPQVLVDVTGEAELRPVADEVGPNCRPPSIRSLLGLSLKCRSHAQIAASTAAAR